MSPINKVTPGTALPFMFILVVACVWVMTGWVRRHALRTNMLDVPNRRSSHSAPTARGGGIAIVAVFIALLVGFAVNGLVDRVATIAIAVSSGAVALIGYLDDRSAIRARIRFAVHTAAAVAVIAFIGGVADSSLQTIGLHGAIAGNVIAVLVVIWSTNLFNFMDGIDGIAGTEAVFVASAGAYLNWRFGSSPSLTPVMLGLAACAAGFLIWNWPPAKIFMGDVGSGFLGFVLAVLGLAASQAGGVPLEAWAILAGTFFVDATVTLLRRIIGGENWFEAHRSHAYQRLAARCKRHLPVTLIVGAINVCWLFPLAVLAARDPLRAPAIVAIAFAPLLLATIFLGAGKSGN